MSEPLLKRRKRSGVIKTGVQSLPRDEPGGCLLTGQVVTGVKVARARFRRWHGTWEPAGHRIRAPLEYSRGPEKTWVYGGLRVADGQEVTMCAPSRNSAAYQDFLRLEEHANPEGTIHVITDNLSSHNSKSTRAWLEHHPRICHAFIPKGACWLNLQEGWWRIFRRQALAGQDFADPDEIAHATQVATAQLNARARPWIWGRPQPNPRSYRRRFIYTL